MGEMGRALNLLTKLGGAESLSAGQVDRLVHYVVLDVLLKVGRGGRGRGRGGEEGAWHLGVLFGCYCALIRRFVLNKGN